MAFHHCVLGKSWVWLFLLGLAPFAFCFVSLLDGEAHIWLGDLRFAPCGLCLCFVCAFDLPSYMTTGVYVDVILHCFFSCKDRASERDRPYRRKKKLYQGSEFGHWKVTGGHDAFAFRHPSLAQTDVRQLLDSEAHHHKVCPIGTGRLIALVGVSSAENATAGTLSVMFGLVSRRCLRHVFLFLGCSLPDEGPHWMCFPGVSP